MAQGEAMDPAEVVQTVGREAMRAAVADSVPFLRFRVERVLDSGDYGSAEGGERMLEELSPCSRRFRRARCAWSSRGSSPAAWHCPRA